ncbi:hypothetical protein [Vibrio sp. LaRot3]|uniref:hypothetical protein n=1 Tax=Vibrio sp. LaRot3 TaxID=2998829 RepID=UPI0022CDE22A|nr:hypothetical protein [Vibrio sp. LaRot3]MDA0149558.1 hypothetical protein [Vibrio sp. LaRot3]
MTLDEKLNGVIQILKESNHSQARLELERLREQYAQGNISEQISVLKALKSWCHPKALGDLRVMPISNKQWEKELGCFSKACTNKIKRLESKRTG